MKKLLLAGCAVACMGFACAESDVDTASVDLEGFYAGLGLSFNHTEFETRGEAINVLVHKTKLNGVGGSVALGYGRCFGSFFGGVEATLDFCKNKKRDFTWDAAGVSADGKCKISGFVPTLALRLGGYIPSVATTLYVRAGAAWQKCECNPAVDDDASNAKISKIAPVIGLGVEKRFGCINARLEGDYRFRANKKFSTEGIDFKNKNKGGYTIRLMALYNF